MASVDGVALEGSSRTPLRKEGQIIDRIHRDGVELPDMGKWGASKQDKAKLGEMFATGSYAFSCSMPLRHDTARRGY